MALTDTVGNATLGELGAGSYQLYVTSEGSGTSATVTVQLKDASTGEWVTIGAGAGATSIVTQGVGAGGTTIDLGTGLSFEVGGVATASGATGVEAATYSLVYAHTGNKVGSQDSSQVFMDLIDTASSQVSKALGYIGATVNRLQYQETSLAVAKVNTEASYNRIMNADMAYEQLEATKWGILQQTAIAMLAQANMVPQSILGLFR
jgi:flagellin